MVDTITLRRTVSSSAALASSGTDKSQLGASVHFMSIFDNPFFKGREQMILDAYLLENNLPDRVEKVGGYVMKTMEGWASKYPVVTGARGKGLLNAVSFNADIAEKVVLDCLANGLIVNNVRPNAVRLAPPLTVTNEEIDEGLRILEAAIGRAS